MKSEKCGYCAKWVCHKPLLGTLHFCLSPEEIAAINLGRELIKQQKNIMALPSLYGLCGPR